MITFHFRDNVPLAALASVLEAIDLLDLRLGSLVTPGTALWLDFFRADIPITRQKLSERIKLHQRFGVDVGARARVLRAQFSSPGFITVDGSGALEKVIDILHSGDLQKEERRAIIERVRAETEMLHAQAAKAKVEALSGAIAALQALGIGNDQIVRLLQRDGTLIKLLGEPVAALEEAQATGILEKASLGPNRPSTD
jgi:hypothetical protein